MMRLITISKLKRPPGSTMSSRSGWPPHPRLRLRSLRRRPPSTLMAMFPFAPLPLFVDNNIGRSPLPPWFFLKYNSVNCLSLSSASSCTLSISSWVVISVNPPSSSFLSVLISFKSTWQICGSSSLSLGANGGYPDIRHRADGCGVCTQYRNRNRRSMNDQTSL